VPRAAASPARARIAERPAPRLWVAASEEAETVARLLGEFRDWFGYSEPDDATLRPSIEQLIADPATEYLLGAPGAGAPAGGVVQLRFRHSIWTGTDDAWLEDLYVRDELRGTGLGRALTEYAIDRARARGCGRIQLDVHTTNVPANALYESLGFNPWQGSTEGHARYMTRRLA
jgi:ribosomal protein S18 acetylase RimI-like enzyme